MMTTVTTLPRGRPLTRAELTAWELRDGRFAQVAEVGEDDAFTADVPFPVRVRPRSLVQH